ncbi:MAG: hypothetical protein JST00_25210 [Deltaproteobacteria bacterium]|nr:hypothetical protein [Deltaproteobacteria bacterium]
MQGFDPRFAQGVRPLAQPPAQGYGQPTYGNAPSNPQSYPQPGQPHQGHPVGPQPMSHSAPPGAYGAPPPGAPMQPMQAMPSPYPPPPSYSQPPPQQHQAQPQAHAGWGVGGVSVGLPGMPSFGANALGGLAAKGPKGLPAPVSFGLTLAAVVIALVFDVIFLKIHIPGVGGYAWYLTTALSFAGAGWASIMWTKASKSIATTAMVVAGVLYGIADLGLGLVLEDLSMAGAIILGAQGVAIACVCGMGGVYKALRSKED